MTAVSNPWRLMPVVYCFLLFRICAITMREIPTNSRATLASN